MAVSLPRAPNFDVRVIYGGRKDTGTDFTPCTYVLACQPSFNNVPFSIMSSLAAAVLRDKVFLPPQELKKESLKCKKRNVY